MTDKIDNNTNITIQDARVVFKNFRGLEDKYNRKGARNFSVVLDDEQADRLKRQGFNVRSRDGREEGDPQFHTLKINVQFATRGRPPRVVMVSSRNKTPIDEGLIDILDDAEITTVDVRFRPYEYEDGKFSAYLVTLFANIIEDELETRYEDIPYQGQTRGSAVSFESFDE